MQFVFQDQVSQFIGALANLVQGVTPFSQPRVSGAQPEIVELVKRNPIDSQLVVDELTVNNPAVDEPITDHPIADAPVGSESMAVLLRPWLPSIEDLVAACSLGEQPQMDFSPDDDHRSIAGNGVQSSHHVRDFQNFVSDLAPASTGSTKNFADVERVLLGESGLTENDFSHAVDEIFEPTYSIWQNN